MKREGSSCLNRLAGEVLGGELGRSGRGLTAGNRIRMASQNQVGCGLSRPWAGSIRLQRFEHAQMVTIQQMAGFAIAGFGVFILSKALFAAGRVFRAGRWQQTAGVLTRRTFRATGPRLAAAIFGSRSLLSRTSMSCAVCQRGPHPFARGGGHGIAGVCSRKDPTVRRRRTGDRLFRSRRTRYVSPGCFATRCHDSCFCRGRGRRPYCHWSARHPGGHSVLGVICPAPAITPRSVGCVGTSLAARSPCRADGPLRPSPKFFRQKRLIGRQRARRFAVGVAAGISQPAFTIKGSPASA